MDKKLTEAILAIITKLEELGYVEVSVDVEEINGEAVNISVYFEEEKTKKK